MSDLLSQYAAATQGAALFERPARGKIEAAGTEAAVFLHNLCTNDVKGLAPNAGCEAFFCTATARVIAHGTVWRHPPEGKRDTFWLDLPAGLDEKFLAHLDRHLISEDVTLTNRTAAFAQFHLAGPAAASCLAALGAEPFEWKPGVQVLSGNAVVRCTGPLGLPGYDLLVPAAEGGGLRDRLTAAGAAEAGAEAWEVLRVEAGTPEYGKEVDENTFAPEVGRTAQAISYNKGCYLGQEPIVMARDRGVVQRGLVGLLVGQEVVPAGSLLYRDGKEVGRVTSSVVSPARGQAVALGYARRGSQTAGTNLEVDVNGTRRPVQVAALPMR